MPDAFAPGLGFVLLGAEEAGADTDGDRVPVGHHQARQVVGADFLHELDGGDRLEFAFGHRFAVSDQAAFAEGEQRQADHEVALDDGLQCLGRAAPAGVIGAAAVLADLVGLDGVDAEELHLGAADEQGLAVDGVGDGGAEQVAVLRPGRFHLVPLTDHEYSGGQRQGGDVTLPAEAKVDIVQGAQNAAHRRDDGAAAVGDHGDDQQQVGGQEGTG